MLHVLVDSNMAAILLSILMEQEQQQGLVELRCAYPSSSLYSSARTILMIRNEPVAVVLDANSTEPEMESRAHDAAEEVIGWSGESPPLRILVAVPSVESLLFKRPDAVRRAFDEVSETLVEIGLVSPGDALRRLSKTQDRYQASHAIISRLDQNDVNALRTESPVRELLEFLDRVKPLDANAVTLAIS